MIGLVLSMLSPVANAQTVPNIFTDGAPALASEVNENFQALASAVSIGSSSPVFAGMSDIGSYVK